GIDALDPQGAEIALLVAAVAIGILRCLFHRLLGGADGILAAPVIALGCLEDLLVAGVGGNASLNAHVSISLQRQRLYGMYHLTRPSSPLERILVPRLVRMYLALWLIRRWRLPATPTFTLPVAVKLNRFLAPDLVFILGILLGPLAIFGWI